MLDIERNGKKGTLYLKVYEYYKNLILEKKLLPGSKMPSLRKSTQELKLSRTTIESAYLQLAADGYIISRAQSGYYVTSIALHKQQAREEASDTSPRCRFDFASSGVDRESFRFDLWSRYIKSALRQDERMLTYGEAQGERDFREALAAYIRERRNIICSPDDIVVGASVQSLLQILCPLIKSISSFCCSEKTDPPSVSFPTPSFIQGSTVFEDFGYEVRYRNKDSDVIYVSPAHMTKWGEIMPVSRRLELLRYASAHGSLVIEDDFENEFVYLQKPTPSLFGLSGGQGVVYIGSFSRLLLPSIRISFMVLPAPLLEVYQKKAVRYNQTASKAEQIALCQFIRDGHLAAQTRKLKRLYSQKLKLLLDAVRGVFGEGCHIQIGAAGTSLALTLPISDFRCCGSISGISPGESLIRDARDHGVRIQMLRETEQNVTVILSCSSMAPEDFVPACRILREAAEKL